jgi:hypothetical protein
MQVHGLLIDSRHIVTLKKLHHQMLRCEYIVYKKAVFEVSIKLLPIFILNFIS